VRPTQGRPRELMNYTISEVKTNYKELDIIKATYGEIGSGATVTPCDKGQYKGVKKWQSLKPIDENETENLERYNYYLRNTNLYRDIDYDYTKYISLKASTAITQHFFEPTFRYGRNGQGHDLYEVTNPQKDKSKEAIEFGGKSLIEFRSTGSYQLLKGKINDEGATAIITALKITKIEYKVLKQKFYEAGLVAQIVCGSPASREGINNYLGPIIGEMYWNKLSEDKCKEFIELYLRCIDREERLEETFNSIESYFKSGRCPKLINKEGVVHENTTWNGGEIKDFRKCLEKVVGKPEKKESQITTGEDIFNSEIKPINWIVKNYIPEGLVILSGRPKQGKSWLGLGAARSLVNGFPFLDSKAEIGNALYYALEDNTARIKRRFESMNVSAKEKKPDFVFGMDCEKKLGEGLEEEIEKHIRERDLKLVIIDTYIRAKGKTSGGNQYEVDSKSLTALQTIAIKHRMAILLIHHTKKPFKSKDGGDSGDEFEQISGTTGIQGIADTLLVMIPVGRRKGKANLFIISRDFEAKDIQMQLSSECNWEKTGNANSEEKDIKTHLQYNILDAVEWWTKPLVIPEMSTIFEADGEAVHRREKWKKKKIEPCKTPGESCTPKQICEYFVLAGVLDKFGNPYKEATIKKEASRLRDTYKDLAPGKTRGTYKLTT